MTARQRVYLLPSLAAGLIAGILIGRAMGSVWYGAAAAALALSAVPLGHGRARFAALAALAVAVGSVSGWLAWHPSLPEAAQSRLVGVIADEVRMDEKGHVRTVLRDVTLDGKPFSSGVYWSFYVNELPEGVAPGATVSLLATLYAPSGADNPGGYDFRESMLQNSVTLGAYGTTELTICSPRFSVLGHMARARDVIARGLMRVMGTESGGYAAAMLVGSRSLIAQEDRDAFSRMGIAHILSVSGFHVGVLSLLLGWLLARTHMGRPLRLIIRVLILAAYALLTGFRAPVVRAAILSLLPEYGRLFHRKSSSLHMISASLILLLLINPTQLTGASFQLTYAAVVGILVVTPWLRERWRKPAWMPSFLYRGLLFSIGAQTGLLLPELYWFQELPLFGLLFNVPVMLLSPVLLGLYWLELFLMWVPGLGEMLGWLNGTLTGGLIAGVRAVGSTDWLTLWTAQAGLIAAAGCVLLLAALSRLRLTARRRLCLWAVSAALIVVGVFPWPETEPSYTQLSVGNADAAVLRDRGMVAVIDTGETQTLSTYLHQRRLSVDALILTHLHQDHAGGLRWLIDDRIPVRRCYIPYGAEQAQLNSGMLDLLHELQAAGTELVVVGRGDVIPLPDGQLTVVWPETGRVRPGGDANESSMALLAQVRGTTLLLTGDLDGVYEQYAAFPADILKAAHHGSAASTSAEFLAAVSPSAIVVSCGDAKRESSLRTRAGETPVYATHSGGAVTVRLMEDSFVVSQFK